MDSLRKVFYKRLRYADILVEWYPSTQLPSKLHDLLMDKTCIKKTNDLVTAFVTSFRNIRILHTIRFVPCDAFQNMRLRSSWNFIGSSIIFNLKIKENVTCFQEFHFWCANLLLKSLELLWRCVQRNELQSAVDSYRCRMRRRTINNPLVFTTFVEWFSISDKRERKFS